MNPKELSALLLLCITSRVLSQQHKKNGTFCSNVGEECNRSNCDPKLAQGCTAGITTDRCDCCDECAQGVGEGCGTAFYTDYMGKCGRGLHCHWASDMGPPGIFSGHDEDQRRRFSKGTCIETKQACKDAGGECVRTWSGIKLPNCDEEMLTGHRFCSPSQGYGCCIPKAPACEAPGSGCPNGLCKERCDYENNEYNAPFQSCGGSNCTCCVAAASCHGNGNSCEGVIGGTCRGECEPGEMQHGVCLSRVSDASQCRCCRKIGNPREFIVGFERFIVLDEHKGATWQEADGLCQKAGYELAQPQIDITKLASYLRIKHGLTYYWLGAKGQGSNITSLSGQVIGSSSPLWRKAYQGFQTSTDFCVYIRDDGNPNPLGTWDCQDTTYMTPLCEANELVPPPPAASLAGVPANSLH